VTKNVKACLFLLLEKWDLSVFSARELWFLGLKFWSLLVSILQGVETCSI